MYYFAYDKNINENEFKQVSFDYKDLGLAKIKDAKLAFKGLYMGIPTFIKEEGSTVMGRLYEIDKENFTVSKLKLREGYLLRRVKVKVKLKSGEVVKAYTFIVSDVENENCRLVYNFMTARKSLFRTMREGYTQLGINIKRLEEAAIFSMLRCYERDEYNGEAGEDC